jgi:carbonic anhydrase
MVMRPTALSPADALQYLKEGNRRFVQGSPLRPNQDETRRRTTHSQGQSPFCTILTCSDSRVPVELVFDQGIGDIFVIRVAGNVVGTNELGSIEYAVEHLGTPLVVVLAHTNCGAVTAVCDQGLLPGNLRDLSANILLAVEEARSTHTILTKDELVQKAVKCNLWKSVDDILSSSPPIRWNVQNGSVVLAGALYDICSGEVSWLERQSE